MNNETKQQMIDFCKNEIIASQWSILKLNRKEQTTKQPMIDFYNNQIKAHRMEIDKLTEKKERVEQSPMFGQALTSNKAIYEITGVSISLCISSLSCYDNIAQGNCFISKKAAELEVEKRKLRQLARLRMSESWGEERPVWGEKWAWCLVDERGPVERLCFRTLHFRTQAHAQAFLDEVGPDGIQKILEL